MIESEKIANAIGNIGDKFLMEALEYPHRQKIYRSIRILSAVAAGICLVTGLALWGQRSTGNPITVYACGTDQQLANGELVLMSGKINDRGEMQGPPLEFYVLGDGIKSIRFSCKNEKISFADWTGQRGDYGLGKNFTVPYGREKEDYYYLVVNWEPQNIIRKLTDNENIKISDLKQKEKEDVIVMEVTYLNGKTETVAIYIKLKDNGNFAASFEPYQITEEDSFIFRQDSLPIEHQP